MIRKIITLLALYFMGGLVLESCNPCGPFKESYFILDEVRVEGFYFEPSANSQNCLVISAPPQDGIPAANFALMVTLNSNTFYSFSQPTYSFGSAAYACSPPPPVYDGEITGFRIYSNQQIDADHPPLSDITGLFEPASPDSQYCDEFMLPGTLLEYLNGYVSLRDTYYFRLKSPIEQPGNYRFFVEVTQDNSRIPLIEAESKVFNLIK